MGLHIGYVYVLVNSTIPGLVKIGMTQNDPDKRARNLSTTGTPGRWLVHTAVYVPHCAAVERAVHRDLKKLRHTRNREFFKISVNDAVRAVRYRADENINQHPGWPDPIAVQDPIDKDELQRKREEEEQTQLSRLKVAAREQKRQREVQERYQRAEQERIAAEKRKKEEEVKALEDRSRLVDKSTRETLSKGPFGWGAFFACVFFGFIFRAIPLLALFAIAGIGILGIWLNREAKKDAINLRRQWNLREIVPVSNRIVAQDTSTQSLIEGSKTSIGNLGKKQEYPPWTVPVMVMSLLGIIMLWASSKNRLEIDETPLIKPELSTAPITPINLTPLPSSVGSPTQAESRQENETKRRDNLTSQQQERRRQKEARKRQAEIRRQQKLGQREIVRYQKTEPRRIERQAQIQQTPSPFILPDIPSNMTPRYPRYPQSEENSDRIRVWKHRDGVWRMQQ